MTNKLMFTQKSLVSCRMWVRVVLMLNLMKKPNNLAAVRLRIRQSRVFQMLAVQQHKLLGWWNRNCCLYQNIAFLPGCEDCDVLHLNFRGLSVITKKWDNSNNFDGSMLSLLHEWKWSRFESIFGLTCRLICISMLWCDHGLYI